MALITSRGTGRGGNATVEVEFIPKLEIVVGEFRVLGARIKSFREPLTRAVRDIVRLEIAQHFADQGPGWPPLSPETINRKGHSVILFETGKLLRLATQMNAWDIGMWEAKFVNLPVYGWAQNNGFTNARTGNWVVAREFLYFDQPTEGRVQNAFQNWLTARLAMSGF